METRECDPGRSFGIAADAYQRGRPEWPVQVLDPLPLERNSTVVELGAGTGKLTRLLASRYSHVIAVEPDPAMRALIRAGRPVSGTAESIPVSDAIADGVFAADAFHWFDADVALAEIARVLTTGGVLAVLWNRFDPEDYVLPQGLMPPADRPAARVFASGEWRRAFAGAPFTPLRENEVPQERVVTREELLDYFASVSPVTSLPSTERQAVMRRIGLALDRPIYERRWTAVVYWTTRT